MNIVIIKKYTNYSTIFTKIRSGEDWWCIEEFVDNFDSPELHFTECVTWLTVESCISECGRRTWRNTVFVILEVLALNTIWRALKIFKKLWYKERLRRGKKNEPGIQYPCIYVISKIPVFTCTHIHAVQDHCPGHAGKRPQNPWSNQLHIASNCTWYTTIIVCTVWQKKLKTANAELFEGRKIGSASNIISSIWVRWSTDGHLSSNRKIFFRNNAKISV